MRVRPRIVLGQPGNDPSFSLRQILSSTPGLITVLFSIFYLGLFQYLRHSNYRDPTSYFFDPSRAYERLYSADRIQQADEFIESAGLMSPPATLQQPPTMCLGIITVKRRKEQYVERTVGSLLEGLDESERNSIYLNLLIGHTEPNEHPISSKKWVETLPNKDLRYEEADIPLIQKWEEGGWYRNKSIFDYTYLLRDCYATGAQYVVMVEDDTLAVRGWYARALAALKSVEAAMKKRPDGSKWLYLRIFYVEDLFGWNSEFWLQYLFWSFTIWALVTGSLMYTRIRTRKMQLLLSNASMVIISGVCVPALIGLCFLAGRNSLWPLKPGIQEMNKFGCCSQGYIFPREIIPSFLEQTNLETDWLVDMMVEDIADSNGYIRWAIVPSLLQHIGTLSSKGWGFDNTAKNLWNFQYELYKRPFPR
ncbi:hypothetical protein BKA64DRAFT_688773 [Cadophora sp. MPI-SDFR-AT-0126]|nr:hypothetical protein BKA64DRAFT_688773 [Leotiomycetes sp. MPI-SDFR-AT-0126]